MVEKGTWEKETYDIVDKYCTSSTTVIDFGAWIGPISIYAAHKAHMVYSVEPDIKAYHLLKSNIKLNNLSNIKTYNMGFHSSYTSIGSKKPETGNSGTEYVAGGNIKSMKLSDFLHDKGNNLFIKFDCEGCEANIFEDLTLFKKRHSETKIIVWLSVHPKKADISKVLKSIDENWTVLFQYGKEYALRYRNHGLG